jgi:hypothetical protein
MSSQERQIADRITRKLADAEKSEPFDSVESEVLARFWSDYFNTDKGRKGLAAYAERRCQFSRFCDNIGFKCKPGSEERIDLAIEFCFVRLPKGGSGMRLALLISDRIRERGIDGLDYVSRDFVRDNRRLFAPALSK